jgi:hypothetical protein
VVVVEKDAVAVKDVVAVDVNLEKTVEERSETVAKSHWLL